MNEIDYNAAAGCYLNRKERCAHPEGEFDKAGRWYPGEAEAQACCVEIRSPSRAWPLSYMKHCRSREHVMRLFGIDPGDKAQRRAFNRAVREQRDLREQARRAFA